MDECVWGAIRLAIRTADRSIPRHGRRPRHRDELIVRLYFWAVAHDRPLCWACRRSSYGRLMRPRERLLLERQPRAIEVRDIDPLEVLLVRRPHYHLPLLVVDRDRVGCLWVRQVAEAPLEGVRPVDAHEYRVGGGRAQRVALDRHARRGLAHLKRPLTLPSEEGPRSPLPRREDASPDGWGSGRP